MKRSQTLSTPHGKLAVLLPGMGAVATTTIAGVMLARRGLAKPIGSLTQLGTLRLDGDRVVKIKDHVPLAGLEDLEFGGWDIFPDDALEAATHAEVLEPRHLEPIREELSRVRPMPGVFYPEYVRRLHGTHIKSAPSKADMVEQLRADIRNFIKSHGCDRAVAVWCGSTEVHLQPGPAHQSIRAFEEGLANNAPEISNAQMYAWACIKERVPFANGAPHLGVDFPAAWDLAREHAVALAGKDFKTGQTMMKTVIAPMLAARVLGLRGWFSTNILGNRDGEVLDDPASFLTKEVSKLGVLEHILDAKSHPELYGEMFHKVRIEYYPPRGDAKEGWDNIDFFGWLGYPMQIKIDFLCRDSILAAPIVLDLALLLDLAQRAGLHGMQEWLSFYFKSPMSPPGRHPEHDLFVQQATLHETLRGLAGEGHG
ncbi:Inositol-1-phosphate synthase [Minicystis rosea]|nr:Inositol-1-phosphate synthase [Minicystis rosea]